MIFHKSNMVFFCDSIWKNTFFMWFRRFPTILSNRSRCMPISQIINQEFHPMLSITLLHMIFLFFPYDGLWLLP